MSWFLGASKRIGKSGLRIGIGKRFGGKSKGGGSSTDLIVGVAVIAAIVWWLFF